MKGKHVALGAAVGIAVLVSVGFNYHRQETAGRGGDFKQEIGGRNNKSEDFIASGSSISDLVGSKKIDRNVVKPLGRKVFSIVRNEQRPPGDALSYVNSLLKKSEGGDASATYAIYLAVSQCNATLQPPSDAVLDIYRQAGSDKAYLELISRNFEECKSLTENSDLSQSNWLQKAAEQGSVEAMVLYAMDPDSVIGPSSEYLSHPEKLVEYRKKSINYLNQAADMGSADAIMALGRAYDNGILVEKSPVKSYAYYKVLESVEPNDYLRNVLAQSEKRLSGSEISQGNELAARIANSCCEK